ncbi:MAG: hypothetical protein QG653_364 [Patescibacteria group bacterium]|nr:hypothetical protein [Patescibacteria group bacterium]
MHDLIKKLEDFFAKAPHLPNDIREIIVKIAPYLAIIGIVFSVLALPALFSIFTIGAPAMMMAGGGGFGGMILLTGLFAVANMVLLILAFPGLQKRQASGWNYVFYSVLLGAVQSILAFNLVGLIVFTTLSLYILFEVKHFYHGGHVSHGHHEGGEHHNHQ